ncbi:hypothetical protein MCP_1845 [Methanocella paludicola SANAE]|uniref:Uncharacterized protein n=1 Tax=Methanocella paludicola (strain DSM 17711 / JCM 13418 / NBRC 101707 / SANAE) TaxID=304371 RepID=D1YZP5_METPS|nr:hypothetical protein [Methanocella paludicola]BAI61917.1 hypothetical protein MCP_1845 [Methanocella paludicola SANAE]
MGRKSLILLVIMIFVVSIAISGCSFSLNPFDWSNDDGGNKNPAPSKGRPTIQQFSPKPTQKFG